MQSIFRFHPIYKERPWGGCLIGSVGSHSEIPADKKIGESWEICDRVGDESVIVEGEFAGKSIRWLLDEHGSRVMGREWSKGRRFPLLVKILDARERLSLQVHPPERLAGEWGGEPKTEMWYLLAADPDAGLLAGLKPGVTREAFEKAVKSNALEDLIHRIPVAEGDVMFIPSGRIHAIDAGCLILEVQQNSDTTYRVFDWGRVDAQGRSRELHVEQSMKCIDFSDVEPSLVSQDMVISGHPFLESDYFSIRRFVLDEDDGFSCPSAALLHVLHGEVALGRDDLSGFTSVMKGGTLLLAAGSYHVRMGGKPGEFVVAECVLKA